MKIKITSKLALVGTASLLINHSALSQVQLKGINTAPNIAGSFTSASLPRDSRFNDPLDLLNDFYPSIEVRLESHSNVRRNPNEEESDFKAIVNPELGYRTDIGRHAFYGSYRGEFVRHADLTQEDTSSHNFSFKLGLDVSRRWDIDLFTDFGNANEERGISGTRDFDVSPGNDNGPDRISYERYGVDLIYGRKLGRLSAVLGYERSESGFTSLGDEIAGGNRDRSEDSFHFDINYRLGGKTSVFARIERETVDFDRFQSSFDSEQVNWLVGLRAKASARLSGVVGYGQSDRDFDDPTLNGFDGNTYYANLTYSVTPFSIFQFGAARSVEEPSSTDASLFISEVFSLSWDHALTQDVVFSAYAKHIDDDFDNGRQDEFFDWGLSLDYAVEPWLTASFYYEDIERDSNFENIAFTDNVFGIRLKSDLRPLFSQRRSKKRIEPESFGRLKRTTKTQ